MFLLDTGCHIIPAVSMPEERGNSTELLCAFYNLLPVRSALLCFCTTCCEDSSAWVVVLSSLSIQQIFEQFQNTVWDTSGTTQWHNSIDPTLGNWASFRDFCMCSNVPLEKISTELLKVSSGIGRAEIHTLRE